MSTEQSPPPLAVVVRAELNGWPVDLEMSIAPARLGVALSKLAELGYTPRHEAAPAPAAAPRNEGPPCCPVHGTAKVKESQHRPGSYYCAAKLADGSYCKEKPC